MSQSDFTKNVSIRLRPEVIQDIQEIVDTAKDPEIGKKYMSVSHFIRCAAIKFIKEERKNIK